MTTSMNPLLATMVSPAAIRTTTISLTSVSVQNVSVSPTVTNPPGGTDGNPALIYTGKTFVVHI